MKGALVQMRKGKRGGMYAVIAVVLVAAAVFAVFFRAVQPEKDAHGEAVRLARKYAHLRKEDAFYRYSRNQTFYTVAGTDSGKRKIYVIVSKNGRKINIYNQKDGISAATAGNMVRRRQNVRKVMNVGMGMRGKTPVWEVTYLNSYGNLCYDIIAFKNGDVIKTIQNI